MTTALHPNNALAYDATKDAPAVRHVLAERYKTKICRNYMSTGVCPYETRCMFAHGEHEMRTSEMNLRDGLITEEAIKSFQRILSLRARAQQQQAEEVEEMQGSSESSLPPPEYTPPEATAEVCQCAECVAWYQHNPYAYNAVTGDAYNTTESQYNATSEPCQCEECMAYYYANPNGEYTAPYEMKENPEAPMAP